MCTLTEDLVRNITSKSSVPLVFRDFVSEWPMCKWDSEKWCSVFGSREIPFRCLRKDTVSDEPCWERKCTVRNMNFKSFLDKLADGQEWMYFDYKYMHQWFGAGTEMNEEINWKQFGFPDKGAAETTMWVGSAGAHTPAHQDTYGVNIVAQLYGKKRWIFFSPETGGLKPTRVPYEESSVYSELNFYCPANLDKFNALGGARVVELGAGDALLVPRGWWHYVQNVDPLNIAVNVWLPHEKDMSAQVSEALIKILVAQVCKDLPEQTARQVVNPNEDDISETPLAVLFLQLETVAEAYLNNRRKLRRAKRQKTCEDGLVAENIDFDMKMLVENPANKLEIAPTVSTEELVSLLRRNLEEFASGERAGDEDEADAGPKLCLTRAVIDAFSQSNAIDVVKQNLFARLS